MNLPKNLQDKIKVNASTIWRLNHGKIRFPKPELSELILKHTPGLNPLDLYPDVKRLVEKYPPER